MQKCSSKMFWMCIQIAQHMMQLAKQEQLAKFQSFFKTSIFWTLEATLKSILQRYENYSAVALITKYLTNVLNLSNKLTHLQQAFSKNW